LHEHLSQIRYVSGISSLVHFGDKIPTVPEAVVDELRQCFESEEPMCVGDRLCAGDEVTLVDGALTGSRGLVVKVMPAKQRVQVLLDFLGRTTLAEVDRRAVQVENQSLAELMPELALLQEPGLAVGA
jgi:transcriptional antiterminator RfaH